MKRYNMTLNEMLAVIAILGILAGILLPTLNYARSRGKQTTCLNNQGQSIKMIFDGISRTTEPKNQLIAADSETGNKKYWTTSLYDRNILQTLEAVRCPELIYSNQDITSAAQRKQAFGVVFSDTGKLDFRGKKLFRTTGTSPIDITASNLLIGGCTTVAANNELAADAVLDFDDNKLVSVHRGKVNMFFFDGSVISVDEKEFSGNAFYYPASDGSGAAKVADSALKTL